MTIEKQFKSNFLLMSIHQIKIFYIFVLNLEEIYLSVKKNITFLAKLRPIQHHGSTKTDLMTFFGDSLVRTKAYMGGGVDSSVPLTRHPTDAGLICLVKKRKIRFRIPSDLRIQSWIILKKRNLNPLDRSDLCGIIEAKCRKLTRFPKFLFTALSHFVTSSFKTERF